MPNENNNSIKGNKYKQMNLNVKLIKNYCSFN